MWFVLTLTREHRMLAFTLHDTELPQGVESITTTMMDPKLMDEIFASAPPFSSEDEEETCRVRTARFPVCWLCAILDRVQPQQATCRSSTNRDYRVVADLHPGSSQTLQYCAFVFSTILLLSKRMVHELTVDEQETAARTSYAYWCWSQSRAQEQTLVGSEDDNDSGSIREDQRDPGALRVQMALREARRHYVGELFDYPSALKRLRQTCQFRKEFNMDDVRTCFAACHARQEVDGTDEASERRKLILSDLENQAMIIRHRGGDVDDGDDDPSVVLLKMGRTSSATNPDAYTLCQFYFAERAFACNEALSKGRREELRVVFDFGSYSSAHSPPKSLVRHTVTLLQQHYPERLKRLHILDPPFWMRALYGLLSVFLSAKTKEKIVLASSSSFASSEDKVEEDTNGDGCLRHENEQDRAATVSNHGLRSPIDLQHFLFDTPFHSAYMEPTSK